MSRETWGLRVPEGCRARPARQESLEEGAALAATEPGGCPDRPAPRVTAASMAWLDYRERRATGVTLVLLAPRGLLGTTEKGATMEKSGPGGCPGSPGRVVCWGRRGPRALQDLLA